MITLFIDTSTSDVSIAIVNKNKILSKIIKTIPNQHSIYTVEFINDCLKEAKLTPKEIEKIMVVTGPGSFTGVRIGLTIAKVYSYIQKIPLIAVSSLKMRAISTTHNNCLSLIDAHHNNYYLGLYNEENQEIINEGFYSKDKVLELIKLYKPLIIGDKDFIVEDIEVNNQELDIIKIVSFYQEHEAKNPHFVVPNYLKLPQALEKKND